MTDIITKISEIMSTVPEADLASLPADSAVAEGPITCDTCPRYTHQHGCTVCAYSYEADQSQDSMHAADGQYVRVGAKFGCIHHPAFAELLAERDRLKAALKPFAALAAGIPDNWPADCSLRIDDRVGKAGWYEYLSYWGRNDAGESLDCAQPLLPTIAEWRATMGRGDSEPNQLAELEAGDERQKRIASEVREVVDPPRHTPEELDRLVELVRKT